MSEKKLIYFDMWLVGKHMIQRSHAYSIVSGAPIPNETESPIPKQSGRPSERSDAGIFVLG